MRLDYSLLYARLEYGPEYIELPVVLALFLLLLLCKIHATRSMTASINSRLAIATPIANFLIEMQNSSSNIACFVADSSSFE
jgi:hypothetical protein